MAEYGKIKGELISTGDAGWAVPMELINLCDGFEYGLHSAHGPMPNMPVGAEYKGEQYRAQAGRASGNPYEGKGSM